MGAECSDCGTDLRFRGDTWPMEAFCEPCELRAQVARLEAEAAPLLAALKGRCCTVEIDGGGNATHEPNCPLSPDAGKDTLCCLKDCGQPAVIGQNFDWHDEGGVLPLCERHVKDRIDRRGWLPPEVAKQVRLLVTTFNEMLARKMPDEEIVGVMDGLLDGLAATLDALKGVE